MPITQDASLLVAELENRRGDNDGHARLSMLELSPRLAQYKMPPAKVGMTVCWYRHGTKHGRPTLGYVVKSEPKAKNIDIYVPTEGSDIVESVPHISDPRLEAGYEHAQQGAWDYTDEYRETAMERQDIESRLAKLESELNNLGSKARKPATPEK